ncbi:MAG TPA: single-stranded DNA-binding protein [Spirochaetota bacterium]|nr:single-stranded DNA-binding protein [Spirochaetota bacterium]HNT12747.1 single-stranded DNA-binding protein [Spirochaetota bacterium]
MSDHNVLSIKGRLTRDPEKRFMPQGSSKAEFAIANNRTHRDKSGALKEQTGFYNCIAWGKVGDVIVKHFRKGDRILIGGRIQQRSWTGDDGRKRFAVEIVVESFNFIEPFNTERVPGAEAQDIAARYPSIMDGVPDGPFGDEGIPFLS